MNIWVEYWNDLTKPNGSHAQMNIQKVFVEPDPQSISRRFFDSHDTAQRFVKSINETGQLARIKTDRSE